jgi:hypothetical protein
MSKASGENNPNGERSNNEEQQKSNESDLINNKIKVGLNPKICVSKAPIDNNSKYSECGETAWGGSVKSSVNLNAYVNFKKIELERQQQILKDKVAKENAIAKEELELKKLEIKFKREKLARELQLSEEMLKLSMDAQKNLETISLASGEKLLDQINELNSLIKTKDWVYSGDVEKAGGSYLNEKNKKNENKKKDQNDYNEIRKYYCFKHSYYSEKFPQSTINANGIYTNLSNFQKIRSENRNNFDGAGPGNGKNVNLNAPMNMGDLRMEIAIEELKGEKFQIIICWNLIWLGVIS